MLISPPFLLARIEGETEDAWIDRCMVGGTPGQGAFPVSFNLGWHGGMHFTAPRAGVSFEPVRAIADGTVVFRRHPARPPDGPLPETHPQAYRGGWTDNGVVVIRHVTEIGEGAEAVVTFFSIYMHLSAIDAAVSTNINRGRILRKTPVGLAGQIYGSGNRQIHFEIVCDDSNLQRLVGRSSGNVPLGADGRRDAVYGTTYVHIPASRDVFDHEPMPNSAVAKLQQPPSAGSPSAVAVPMTRSFQTPTELVVALRGAGGEGAVGHRGSVFARSHQLDGSTAGAELEDVDGEYNFYSRAKRISASYPHGGRPATSAVYELLRFGRVIGPDPLRPADTPCWRKIRGEAGRTGWVNLNVSEARKFSDADFPHWQGWSLVDDSADRDSRCDSALVKGWLDIDGDGLVSPAELTSRSADGRVAHKLARAICKFSTEWDASRTEAQWGWLKKATIENPLPLNETSFGRLTSHLAALQFWPGGTGLPAEHWHFQPREFVRHLRKCGWRSLDELSQMFPRHLFYTTSGTRSAITAPASTYSLSLATARARLERHHGPLNLTMRKYSIDAPRRQAHFLAQVMLETAQWRNIPPNHLLMHEWGFGAYSAANPMTQYYASFYGRGVMQLTWAGNYRDYGDYRSEVGIANNEAAYAERLTPAHPRITSTSVHWTESPANGGTQISWAPRFDPDLIATNPFNACDSGAYYWVSKHHSGDININRVCDRAFTVEAVGRVNALVNGGGNGYYERQAYSAYIHRLLSESVATSTEETVALPSPRSGIRISYLKST